MHYLLEIRLVVMSTHQVSASSRMPKDIVSGFTFTTTFYLSVVLYISILCFTILCNSWTPDKYKRLMHICIHYSIFFNVFLIASDQIWLPTSLAQSLYSRDKTGKGKISTRIPSVALQCVCANKIDVDRGREQNDRELSLISRLLLHSLSSPVSVTVI